MSPADPRRIRSLGGHRVFEVLTVCTANVCRSPIMEAHLRAGLGHLPGAWSVGSAGTHARGGQRIHPDSAQALADEDLELPDGWRSRRLTAADIERADLVLTATRAHRGVVVGLVPQATRRAFTLAQFARLVAAAPDAAAHPGDGYAGDGHAGDALVRAAIAARGLAGPARPCDDDLVDPIGRQARVFRELADTVGGAVSTITSQLLVPH